MKTLTAFLAGAAAFGLVSVAHAQTPGWYIGLGAGPTLMEDPDTDITVRENRSTDSLVGGFLHDPKYTAHMAVGFGANINVGYAGLFMPQIRAEGEISYRSNGVDQITNSAGPPFPPGTRSAIGTIDSAAFMVNGYYDFLNSSQWTPYLGAGIGAARVTINDVGLTAGGPTFSGNDWQFAYQGIAGVRYTFNPTWSASLDYRYFATMDPKFSVNILGVKQTATTQYATHNIMLGVAYHFTPAPPPPPPVAAAAPPPPAPAPPPQTRQFTVYFEFDKSALTPEGSKVVSDAAAYYKQTGSVRVAITGYTDLAGTQQYNLGLSKRRADTVRAALGKAGVPDSAIAESWRGKENPAVPTPDGVREPRNRRVEIVI
jgi:outer membrane protein OmpA-like peptidoglycan-associated protein